MRERERQTDRQTDRQRKRDTEREHQWQQKGRESIFLEIGCWVKNERKSG